MSDVQVIKANKSENRFRGRKVEILRVAAYCRVSTLIANSYLSDELKENYRNMYLGRRDSYLKIGL